jgi:dihydroxy-acid dehydratase
MAMGRMNVPAVFVYGGTILPGKFDGKDVDIVSIFEAVGQYNNKLIDEKAVKGIECAACPGPGFVWGHVHRQHHGLGH